MIGIIESVLLKRKAASFTMPIYLRNIKLALEEPQERLLEKAARRLRVPRSAIRVHAVVRRSLDARRPNEIGWVYSLELALNESAASERQRVERLHRQDVRLIGDSLSDGKHSSDTDVSVGTTPLIHRPIVVGFGPAGMFAAYRLAQYGYCPIVLERGREVPTRHRDVLQKFFRRRVFDSESNLLFGEGGAGAYSDGKLYTRVNHPYVQNVMQIFYEHGADPKILIDGKPHIGSDRLPGVCMNIRRRIVEWGGEVRFGARVDDFCFDSDGQLTGVVVDGRTIQSQALLLAPGHSARDTMGVLARRGVILEAKPFQMGIRIEHPQELVDRWQYGDWAGHDRLPPAEYHLVARGAAAQRGDVFSFCMCPGGMILPAQESPGLLVTNGASRASRGSPWANSGLVVTVPVEEFDSDPLRGLYYQRHWEELAFQATGGDYSLPVQRACDFLANRESDGGLTTSYPLGGRWANLRSLMPPWIAESIGRALEMLGEKMRGFSGSEAILAAPETRASTPVRIVRDPQSREAIQHFGLFPIGEGAGYAGGIVSAAVDGMKSADIIIKRYAPLR